MKKLSLSLEDLSVDSFDTTAHAIARRGTVRGADASDTTCAQVICDCRTYGYECPTNDYDCPPGGSGGLTCDPSCAPLCSDETCPPNTCAYSCEGTCGCPTWYPNETCGIC